MTDCRDARLACDIGRSARADLTCAVRNGRTVVARSYAEPPFRSARGFSEGTGLHVILTASAPGVFGGDSLSQTVVVEPGAHLRLTSQSALQVHPSSRGDDARLASRYRVGRGAGLFCAWDPAIPFPGARLDQRTAIELDAGARLVWSEAVMSGRVARGERWQFAMLAHELMLSQEGALRYLERFRIRPDTDAPERRWVASDACYFGTVLAAGSEVAPAAAETLHRSLNATGAVRAAVDLLEKDVLLVRLMAASGPAFHHARAAAYASAVSCA